MNQDSLLQPHPWRQGLLENNPALVQLLGLCPLLAISNTLVSAIGLGLATLLTVMLSNTLVALLRPLLRQEVRIAMFVIIIAGIVTVIDLLMEAWLYELHGVLGIFLPLIVTNCLILARAETFASKTTPLRALRDGLAMGCGFMLVLVLLGAIRELLAYTTLLRDADLLLAGLMSKEQAQSLTWHLVGGDYQFLLFSLPPGAFLILALLVAAHRQLLQRRRQQRDTAAASQPELTQAST